VRFQVGFAHLVTKVTVNFSTSDYRVQEKWKMKVVVEYTVCIHHDPPWRIKARSYTCSICVASPLPASVETVLTLKEPQVHHPVIHFDVTLSSRLSPLRHRSLTASQNAQQLQVRSWAFVDIKPAFKAWGHCWNKTRFPWGRDNFFWSARPYESCKIFKGRPCRNAFSKLVHRQYKSFPTDRFCQVEIQKTTRLSNETSTA